MAGFDEKDYERTYLPRIRELHREGGVDAFLRYGLDLEEDDTARIKARVASVQSYWARKFNHPSDAGMYKILHADAEVRRQLEDPESRNRLRLAIKDERAERERGRIRRLDRDIEIAAVDGYLTPEAVTSLINNQVRLGFEEGLIRKRIASIPVQKPAAAKPLEAGLPQLTRQKIDTALATRKEADLYVFLNLPRDATSAQWKEHYKLARERASTQRPGPRVQAANSLLGIIKDSLLEDPGVYANVYSYQLALSMEPHVKQLGVNGAISELGYKRLLKEGLELGLTEERCSTAIRWLAQKNSIAIATRSGASADGFSLCKACDGLIEGAEKRKQCPHCGHDLWTKCPECANLVRVADSCTQCGFPLARKEYINKLLELGTKKIQQGDLEEAAAYLDDLERVWMTGHVSRLRQKWETARDRFEGVYKRFRSALAGHKPFLARDLLEELRSVGAAYEFHDGATLAVMESSLGVVLADLEKTLKAARAALAGHETEKAVTLFEEALRKASDSIEARKGLSMCVPEPPTSLRWTMSAKSVRLEWQPSLSSGTLDYVVVSSEARAPKDLKEGTELTATKELHYEDTGPKPGTGRFYSVFARREEAISTPLSSTLVLARLEVRGLAVVIKDGFVEGTWERLPDQARAIITRTSVGAAASSEGQQIKSDSGSFLDKTVTMGGEYQYHVAVEYTAAGRASQTEGLVCRIHVDEQPDAVTQLQIARKNETQKEIRWTTPARGDVEIFALTERPKWKTGSTLTSTELARWSAFRLPTVSGVALWTRPSAKPRFLTALTVLHTRAVLGVSVLDVEDVTELKGDHLESRIELRWVWPVDCNFVLVTWKHDTYPQAPDDAAAQYKAITRGAYNNTRGFQLAQPKKENFYFTVFAGTTVEGTQCYGGGASDGARVMIRGTKRVRIEYELLKPRMSFNRKVFTLRVTSDDRDTVLPDLTLVSRRNGPLPVRLEDGVPLQQIRNRNAPYEVEIRVPEPGYLRVLLAKPTESDRFQIVDPSPAQLDWTQ